MSTNLTFDQMQAVASLLENPGYVLVLESLQANIDDLASQFETAQTDEAERRLVSEWRATRRVLAWLKSTPQAVASDIAPEREKLSELQPILPQTPQDFQAAERFFRNPALDQYRMDSEGE